ncbi:MAG: transcriptional regulator [Planctomycetota bacterium]|nr:MAG: transcriptional regulator [Planctomycetota bacterium]
MSAPFNILLSSAGHRVKRVEMFRATLAELGLSGKIVAADLTPLSAAMQVADAAEITPRCTSAEFIPALLDVCRRHAISLVVPGIDPELPALAAAREQFAAAGVAALISSPDTVAIAADKWRTHHWLVEHGFPTVEQTTVADALASPNAWPFPLFIKPALGSGSVGAAAVADADELRFRTRGGDFVVQTLAAGVEYTVDVLVDRAGKCLTAIPRRRIEVRSGEVFKGVTHRRAELIDLAGRIAETLPGAYGPLNIQMFFDEPRGTIQVIEINPRFAGGFPLAWEAGGKFPRWIIEEILGRPSTATANAWKDGLVMLRHFDAVFVDAATLEKLAAQQRAAGTP